MLNRFRIATLAVSVCIITAPAFSATLTVKQDGSGNHTTIQSAIDAAQAGDTIVISAGTYTEDVSIGNFNVPAARKDNLTIMAAPGESVAIVAANATTRYGGLAAAGNDVGPIDYLGFIVHSANTVIEGLKIVQPSTENNALGINFTMHIGGPDITIRNCVIEGPSVDAGGDIVGLVVATLDVAGLLQGNPTIATNTVIEDCVFQNNKYGFASSDFLGTGVPPVVSIKGCQFNGNGTGIEVDDGILEVSDCYFSANGRGIHISDDQTTLINCTIVNSIQHGVEFDNQDAEDNDPLDVPKIVMDGCIILNCGTEAGHRGIFMEMGNLTVTNSVVANSFGHNVFFEGDAGRETRVSFDHCDIYKSGAGVAVYAPASAGDIITFTIKNSNIVDAVGIVNETIGLGDFTVEFCNVFTTGEQFVGDFLATTNILKVDPMYVDAENGKFGLEVNSPVSTAGENFSYIGSQGPVGANHVEGWMIH